jgi:predicted transport protein
MPIYKNQNNKLTEIVEVPFQFEREIQRVFEGNLETVMSLTFVKSEFTIKNKRIDTLAYDTQSNAFIIIEYKRDKNLSVVDQGFTYLSLMLENKADFIIEYNETLKQSLKRDDVDWSQTRVAFVSTSFTENQVLATNFKDIAIELWEVKRLENDLFSVTPIKKTRAAESIKPLTQQNQVLTKVIGEIKVYTEDEHIAASTEEIAELYAKFKNAVLNLADDIEIKPTKLYVAFKKGKNLIDFTLQKKSLKMCVNAKYGTIEDTKGLAKDVSSIGHYGNGDYEIQVTNDNDLEYIMSLVKQVVKL